MPYAFGIIFILSIIILIFVIIGVLIYSVKNDPSQNWCKSACTGDCNQGRDCDCS